MENKLSFKIPGDTSVELSFDPAQGLLVILESDTTPLKIEVQSPTKKDSQEWVGGMKKR